MSLFPKRLKTRDILKWNPIISSEYTNTEFILKPFMVADVKDYKTLSYLIAKLQQSYPLGDHIKYKRVRKIEPESNSVEKKSSFQILIAPKEDFKGVSNEIAPNLMNIREFELPIDKILTRTQYDIASKKYWPLQFHLDKHIESLLDKSFMSENDDLFVKYDFYSQLALDLAKFFNSKSAAVLVDLKSTAIVACGIDKRNKHSLDHCVIDAINTIAKRQVAEIKNDSEFKDEQLLKFLNRNENYETFRVDMSKKLNKNDYLCTDYAVFLTHEPCSMCAMALIHSRISKVFYLFNTSYGYLNTRFKLHLEKHLNHTYEVYEAANLTFDSENFNYFHDEKTRHPNILGNHFK